MVRLLPLPPLGIATASLMSPAKDCHDRGSNNSNNNDHNSGNDESNAEGVLLRGHTGTVRDLCFPWCPPVDNPEVSAKHSGKQRMYTHALVQVYDDFLTAKLPGISRYTAGPSAGVGEKNSPFAVKEMRSRTPF